MVRKIDKFIEKFWGDYDCFHYDAASYGCTDEEFEESLIEGSCCPEGLEQEDNEEFPWYSSPKSKTRVCRKLQQGLQQDCKACFNDEYYGAKIKN